MKPLSIALTALVLLLFVAAGVASALFLGGLAEGEAAEGQAALPRFRAAAILPDGDDSFYPRLAEALERAGRTERVALVIRKVSFARDREGALGTLERTMLGQPDGLILFGSGQTGWTELIDQAVGSGIPVVTVGSDAPGSLRQCFVGTNGFSLGQQAGNFIREIAPAGARVGIIIGQIDPAAGETETATILSGLAAALGGSSHRIVDSRVSRSGLATGEDAAVSLLDERPDINVLFCTTTQDTLAAAQTLVDRNRVGQVLLIGTDETPEILDYIDKGVVSGTFVRNPDNLGRLAVKALYEQLTTGNGSGYFDPGTELIVKRRLAEYRARSSSHGD